MEGNMENLYTEDFQLVVDAHLDRNRNILDALTKYDVAVSRCLRAVVKASTQCGCIEIGADKQPSEDCHVTGELCAKCRDKLEQEIGEALFYLAAIANTFDISLMDCMIKEKKQLELLGNFSLK